MASAAYPTQLETLAQAAAFKLRRSEEYQTSASILLAECERRVNAGDPDAKGARWTDYCRVRFPEYTPSYLCKLIRARAQPDHRHDELQDPQQPFDCVWAGFVALDRSCQYDLLRCAAFYIARFADTTRQADSGSSADLPNVFDRLA